LYIRKCKVCILFKATSAANCLKKVSRFLDYTDWHQERASKKNSRAMKQHSSSGGGAKKSKKKKQEEGHSFA
jgi:hypothetical protein